MTAQGNTPANVELRPAVVERLAFNAEETAQALDISLVTLWRLEKRGLLKPSRALRTPRWSRTEIERFLEATK
jgi:predicted site-specific integrase-resolvase